MEYSALNTNSTDAVPRKFDIKSLNQEELITDSSLLPRLPCGHHIPPDYLIAWIRSQLEHKHTEFTCPRFVQPKQRLCGASFSYHTVCELVQLKPKTQQYFEETISALTALTLCDYKKCPGCHSYVERAEPNNLCVQCSICTSNKLRIYQFCWLCQREWRGPYANAKHCANEGCGQSKVSQGNSTSSLEWCHHNFKTRTLQSEKDDIYMSMDKSDSRTRLALLINNVEFEQESDRTGAEVDEKNMRILLENLGYTVLILRNLTSQGMEAAMADFSQRGEHLQSDSCFVVIMSHGTQEGICGVSYGDDQEDILPVDSIFHHLNTPSCPALRDKPKVILIQACRGGEKGDVWVADSAPISRRKKEHREKDFICLRSCTPDTVSYRNTKTGSVFIQTVVQTLNEHAHEDHIEELFRKVLKTFKNSYPDQMPCKDRTTLSRKFYLFPGL
ncbi:caspase-23 isoform X2 [Alosa alosa]|uniref:caspase-23 isoform X2 n=1 Tax=Alosa alosa TaxID=278164 RepID=UPI0020151F4F|nr:caspase-23 isoform X2 [Alosa alosa]